MNLLQLRNLTRVRLKDTGNPPLWSDEFIDGQLNEAERETCSRANLIDDDSSAVTQIAVTTSSKRYAIDPVITDVIEIEAALSPGVAVTGWTLTDTHLVFDRLPTQDDTLTLHCYRRPLIDMVDDTDEPEISARHHDRMVDWAVSLCYLVPDTDGHNPNAAAFYADRFTQSFGEAKSALTMRNHRDKAPKTVACNGDF
ncbi:MAG: hypothetical protein H6953_19080 [Chromatiaceae bacterium]|nr:hypothetical protein [Chromatiaceae bacterium]